MQQEIKKFMQSRNMDQVLELAEKPLLDDKKIERVEIIVLKYKSPEMEKDCVSRIIEYTQWPYKLNVFDNRGNGPNTSKAWNKLIRESTCDYIVLIDSDAFVQNTIGVVRGERQPNGVCWLTEMMKAYKRYDNVAIVGPVAGTNSVSTMQAMAPKDEEGFTIDGHLSGYCFLTPRSIYDKIGYFDEDFCFYGQESDWIQQILEEGKYRVVIAPRAHVTHGYEQVGSESARQAEKEGELSIEKDASYSYLMWNEKKRIRFAKKGIEYKYPL